MPGMERSLLVGCRFVLYPLLAAGMLFAIPSTSLAQQGTPASPPSATGSQAAPVQAPESPCTATANAAPMSARQVRLCQQTQHLHQLALQLQSAVDRSSKDTLSVDVLRLSDQIQVLAHQIQVELKQP
jgi:hypothetical protein